MDLDATIELPRSTLSPQGSAQVERAFRENGNRKIFRLPQSVITDASVPDLCRFLEMDTPLQHFDLPEARFTDDDLQKLLPALTSNPTLTYVSLSGVRTSGSILDDLCKLCQQNRTLSHLCINVDAISDKGLGLLLKGLHTNKRMQEFKLSNCKFTDDVIPTMYDVCRYHPSLIVLWMKQATDDGVHWALGRITKKYTIRIAELTGERLTYYLTDPDDGWVTEEQPPQQQDENASFDFIDEQPLQQEQSMRRAVTIEFNQKPRNEEPIRNAVSVQLKRTRSVKTSKRDPAELQTLHRRFTEAYNQAMRTGSQRVCETRVMIVGHHGAGKTSLLDSLLRRPFKQPHKSTIGIDHDTSIIKIEAESGGWKLQDEEGSDASGKARITLREQNDKAREEFTKSLDSSQRSIGNSSLRQLARVAPELRQALNKELQKESKSTSFERVVKLQCWDFAGQAAFYCTHQTFLTSRAVYVLVLDVTQSLDDELVTYRTDQKGQKVPDTAYPDTVRAYFDYWMNCICSLDLKDTRTAADSRTGASSPEVIVVCTHTDMVPNPETAHFVAEVREHIGVKPYKDHVVDIFTLSNKARDDADIQDVKDELERAARDLVYDLPLSWMELKRSLKEGNEKTKSWHQAKKAGENAGIGENELRQALGFLHTVGDVIFFDEPTFRDVIITDPKWLITQMKQVITVPSLMEKVQFKGSDTYWRHLEVFGVVHLDMLRYVWPQESIQNLLTIVKKLQLLLPLPRHYPLSLCEYFGPPEGLFLVPCLLPPSGVQTRPSSPVPSVVLQPERHFIPLGLTSRLITSLLNDTGWKVVGQMFRDSATLLPNVSQPDLKVRIQQEADCILVHAVLPNRSPGPSLNMSLATIETRLYILTSTVCPLQSFRLGIRCQYCRKGVLLLENKNQLQDAIRCDECCKENNTSSYSPWFKEVCVKPIRESEHQQSEDIRRKLSTTFRDNITQIEGRLDFEKLTPHLTDIRRTVSKLRDVAEQKRVRHLVAEVVVERMSAVYLAQAMLAAGYEPLLRELGFTATDINYIRGLGNE